MSRINAILAGTIWVGAILVEMSYATMAQEVPQIPTAEVPTVETDQLFPVVPTAPAIEPPALPEVTTIITPEVPTTEFPEADVGESTLNPPTLDSIPFNAPQLNGPQLTGPAFDPSSLSAPNLAAPAFNALQANPPDLSGPAFDDSAFAAPNLASPTLAAPTLTFIAAPESEDVIQSVDIPQTELPEVTTPFDN